MVVRFWDYVGCGETQVLCFGSRLLSYLAPSLPNSMVLVRLCFAWYLQVNAEEAACRTLFQRSQRWSPRGFPWAFPEISCGTREGDPSLGAGFEASESLAPGHAAVALQCPACGSGRRILYGPDRFDGSGERLTSLIFYMALAARSSYSFGGLIQMKLPFEPIPRLYAKVSSMILASNVGLARQS